MATCHQNLRQKSVWCAASLAIASLLIIATGDATCAASVHKDRSTVSADPHASGDPILAVVSLRDQQITVYDSHGSIAHAPVSTGQKGRETPAGIFSVIEKQAEHYSNLYDDASMPHMQRITWSGIALHGGPLPGYAASHGCVRMPYDFATRLFDMTKMGMRVIVTPSDAVPIEISHPVLFQPAPGAGAAAAARAAEAAEAARNADQAKLAVTAASRDAAKATASERAAGNVKTRADAQLALAERSLAPTPSEDNSQDTSQDSSQVNSQASSQGLEQAKQNEEAAAAKAAEADAQLASAKAELQQKLDALSSAREAATTARAAATQLAHEAARDLQPVSVFVSRKTQRLYVRQGFQPLLETPVSIVDGDRPIGTHVFTAMDLNNEEKLRWSVVSLNGEHRASARPDGEPDLATAKEALDRITIPQDVLDRVSGIIGPRSSLIISDEAASSETGKGTDFIVVLSGEPQGGIKFRRHDPEAAKVQRPRGGPTNWSAPFASRYSDW